MELREMEKAGYECYYDGVDRIVWSDYKEEF